VTISGSASGPAAELPSVTAPKESILASEQTARKPERPAASPLSVPPALAVDIPAELPALRFRPGDGHAAADSRGNTVIRTPIDAPAPLRSDAALTVVIRDGESRRYAGTTVSATSSSDAQNNGSQQTDESQQSSGIPPANAAQQTNGVSRTSEAGALSAAPAAGAAAPSGELLRRKAATEADIAANAAPARNPETTVPAGSVAGAQVPKSSAEPATRSATQPAAAAETAPPEKEQARPLKSVALEFTPDGARDVRVRLSERAGVVHISLHSSDPSMTKNLRDGMGDLTSVLEHAGYDANAWTSGGDKEQPQQREEPAPGLQTASGPATESFGSMLGAAAPPPQ
jgi:hypothetical protein